ncbi:hypothetical protein PHO31112_05386 [Pandoraea horticolens]|uniref:Uncharacterized protein n=1 Tax=Pandoraea horticolens TaxID=2508298 RepID=A0A5E4ZDQ9_9BURK|nr:hypothetical protein [Pandoraea horticolens]VVE58817.1 hypothetical protein PHO31112_05386 [Pandoraea horticolens]
MTDQTIQLLACKPIRQPMAVTTVDRELCPPENGQQFTLVSIDPAIALTNVPATSLDTVQMAGFWTLALTTIVGLWFVSVHVGALLGFIRRG